MENQMVAYWIGERKNTNTNGCLLDGLKEQSNKDVGNSPEDTRVV